MSTTSQNSVPALQVTGLSKTFPGQRALSDVAFDLRPGEVHALVGQNGSGKSTFMKVLAGYHEPDEGSSCLVDGRPLLFGDPIDTLAAGLRFVHQDLALVPTLNALDNLALGRGYVRNRAGTISWRREAAAARAMLHDLGYDFDLDAPVARLTAAERTGIAVARALQGWEGGAKVLVLDEPTAALPAGEVERLFEVVNRIRDRVAVIYISHHFSEVFAICDRVTVLRDGRRVTTRDVADLDEDQLIELTVGRALERVEAMGRPTSATDRQALSVTGLGGRVLDGLDLEVRAGEVVGFAGVTGSGREEIASLLFGAASRTGEVRIGEQAVPGDRPHRSMRAGMALVPAERATLGVFSDMTLRENVTLSSLTEFMRPLGLKKSAERARTRELLEAFEVSTTDSEALISQLSGGNQQKVLLGRAMRLDPSVLVLDEPTQGVDVGAKAAIHQMVDDAARKGTAVVVAATESEELVRLCDRIVVLTAGRVHAIVSSGEVTPEQLTELTLGRPLALPA